MYQPPVAFPADRAKGIILPLQKVMVYRTSPGELFSQRELVGGSLQLLPDAYELRLLFHHLALKIDDLLHQRDVIVLFVGRVDSLDCFDRVNHGDTLHPRRTAAQLSTSPS
jgi:hypothetical protein